TPCGPHRPRITNLPGRSRFGRTSPHDLDLEWADIQPGASAPPPDQPSPQGSPCSRASSSLRPGRNAGRQRKRPFSGAPRPSTTPAISYPSTGANLNHKARAIGIARDPEVPVPRVAIEADAGLDDGRIAKARKCAGKEGARVARL